MIVREKTMKLFAVMMIGVYRGDNGECGKEWLIHI